MSEALKLVVLVSIVLIYMIHSNIVRSKNLLTTTNVYSQVNKIEPNSLLICLVINPSN